LRYRFFALLYATNRVTSASVQKAVEIFYSYALEDKQLCGELERHLSALKQAGIISNWHAQLVEAGINRESAINAHLNSAQIILLLVSSDFLASHYCYSIEMRRAMERHDRGDARVIPILLRPVDWEITPISKLQALPSNGLPVINWSNRDEAFQDIARGIRWVIQTPPPSPYQPPDQGVQPFMLSNMQKIPNPPPDPDPPPQPSVEAMWQEEGVMGERIKWYVEDQEWGRAEAAAREAARIVPRSRIMGKLVTALIQVEEWQRAEAIAHDIALPANKETALTELAIALAEHKQWPRAGSVAHSIRSYSTQANVLRELSLAARSAGERNIALSFMQEAERLANIEETMISTSLAMPSVTMPSVQSLSPPITASPPFQVENPRPSRRRSSGYWHHILLLLSLICAITAITRLGPAPLTVIAWVVTGALFILWIIIVIARRY
jgi:TIR domain